MPTKQKQVMNAIGVRVDSSAKIKETNEVVSAEPSPSQEASGGADNKKIKGTFNSWGKQGGNKMRIDAGHQQLGGKGTIHQKKLPYEPSEFTRSEKRSGKRKYVSKSERKAIRSTAALQKKARRHELNYM